MISGGLDATLLLLGVGTSSMAVVWGMSLEVVISSSNTCEGSDESSTAKEFESTSAEVIAELKSIDVDAKFVSGYSGDDKCLTLCID